MDFALDEFGRHISIEDDSFCIDYKLRDYIVITAFQAAQQEFDQTNHYLDLVGFRLIKTVEDERMIRLMEYLVPISDGRFYLIEDSKLHPMR